MDAMAAAQTRWPRLMRGPCKREAFLEDQQGHAPAGPVCARCGPWRSATPGEQWSDALGAPARYSWAFASEESVAHYRKQASGGSHVLDVLTPDFHIWPQQGTCATAPQQVPHPRLLS